MKQEEVKDYLCDHGWEETIVFENPDYAPAIAGYFYDCTYCIPNHIQLI